MFNKLSQLAQISGGWVFGVDYTALFWLIVTSIGMVVGPALISVVYYLLIQDSQIQDKQMTQDQRTRVLQPSTSAAPVKGRKRAA